MDKECGCGCGGQRSLNNNEKTEMLEKYREDLRGELEEIEEELKKLRNDENITSKFQFGN
jgi:hypothetical protein